MFIIYPLDLSKLAITWNVSWMFSLQLNHTLTISDIDCDENLLNLNKYRTGKLFWIHRTIRHNPFPWRVRGTITGYGSRSSSRLPTTSVSILSSVGSSLSETSAKPPKTDSNVSEDNDSGLAENKTLHNNRSNTGNTSIATNEEADTSSNQTVSSQAKNETLIDTIDLLQHTNTTDNSTDSNMTVGRSGPPHANRLIADESYSSRRSYENNEQSSHNIRTRTNIGRNGKSVDFPSYADPDDVLWQSDQFERGNHIVHAVSSSRMSSVRSEQDKPGTTDGGSNFAGRRPINDEGSTISSSEKLVEKPKILMRGIRGSEQRDRDSVDEVQSIRQGPYVTGSDKETASPVNSKPGTNKSRKSWVKQSKESEVFERTGGTLTPASRDGLVPKLVPDSGRDLNAAWRGIDGVNSINAGSRMGGTEGDISTTQDLDNEGSIESDISKRKPGLGENNGVTGTEKRTTDSKVDIFRQRSSSSGYRRPHMKKDGKSWIKPTLEGDMSVRYDGFTGTNRNGAEPGAVPDSEGDGDRGRPERWPLGYREGDTYDRQGGLGGGHEVIGLGRGPGGREGDISQRKPGLDDRSERTGVGRIPGERESEIIDRRPGSANGDENAEIGTRTGVREGDVSQRRPSLGDRDNTTEIGRSYGGSEGEISGFHDGGIGTDTGRKPSEREGDIPERRPGSRVGDGDTGIRRGGMNGDISRIRPGLEYIERSRVTGTTAGDRESGIGRRIPGIEGRDESSVAGSRPGSRESGIFRQRSSSSGMKKDGKSWKKPSDIPGRYDVFIPSGGDEIIPGAGPDPETGGGQRRPGIWAPGYREGDVFDGRQGFRGKDGTIETGRRPGGREEDIYQRRPGGYDRNEDIGLGRSPGYKESDTFDRRPGSDYRYETNKRWRSPGSRTVDISERRQGLDDRSEDNGRRRRPSVSDSGASHRRPGSYYGVDHTGRGGRPRDVDSDVSRRRPGLGYDEGSRGIGTALDNRESDIYRRIPGMGGRDESSVAGGRESGIFRQRPNSSGMKKDGKSWIKSSLEGTIPGVGPDSEPGGGQRRS